MQYRNSPKSKTGQAGPKQPLTKHERDAMVRKALEQAEALLAQAFRMAPMTSVIQAQLRVRGLVVKEAERRRR